MNSGIGFKDCFARVPLACLGTWQHGTRQQGWYTSGTLKKKLIKPTTQFIRLLAVQGGPSASGKRYVDSKFEVAFSCEFIL